MIGEHGANHCRVARNEPFGSVHKNCAFANRSRSRHFKVA